MGTLLFEVKTPDGNIYQLHDDGGMKGFPDGTMIESHVADVKRREHPVMRFYDSRFPDLFIRRRLVVTVENDSIGEGLFVPEVSKVLRELADAMDAGEAGKESSEAYLFPCGTLVTVMADDVNAVCIRGQRPDPKPRAVVR